ncbi:MULTISPECIES: hypothetical protein [Francisella]|uniref:Uncharacterized protein n=1 Tax=Francisella opportunistica TaxID=2016517 RepID=A0A345JTJ8_9GAMM|nr:MULTISPECIES: hypothetical protein [Francisella]APC92443.1 hypothetical protein BBG19_1719 [Francisella sp. MA067296]AXH30644.1 hypothetical protein CGC43_08710 [Francisella opportunistica]AXH32284.1 hypothetical protein CGC44_08680 [Francisella opportunistica]AXH33933.1 hypothetical protein CGC45_08740 [Francisella opportunistica]
MDLTFLKQNSLSILIISVVAIAVFILIIKMYKKIIQRLLFYKKGLGKINGFFAKLFKVNALNEIYLEFYRSLSLWQKIKLYFAKKNILIDSSIKTENQFGIYFKLEANQLKLYVNPQVLYESKLNEADILCLFSKVFRGYINLVVVNLDAKLQKSNLSSSIEPVSNCFNYISRYLSTSFNYVVNIVEEDDNIAYKVWCEYTQIANINNFWPNEKPSSSWLNIVTTKYTDKQLCLNEQPFSSEQIRDLYYFLNNCLKYEYFINLLQAEVSNKIAKYKGFGINLFRRNKFLKSRLIQQVYSSQKFTKKFKKASCFIIMFLLTLGFIIGWYQVKNNVKNIVNEIPLTGKYSGLLDEINLKNYYQSLDDAFYNNFIIALAYHNAGKKELDRFWEKFIYKHVIIRTLAKADNPIQKLALNIVQTQVAKPSVRELISDNLWLWSKVTKIPENILSVWLEINHSKANTEEVYKLSFDEDKDNNTIKYVEDFIGHIFEQKAPLKASLDKTMINQVLELALLDQLVNDHDLNIHIHDSKAKHKPSLSYQQKVDLNHFIIYLELRNVISSVTNAKNIKDRVDQLSKIKDSVKQLTKTLWDKKLASFMLQSISDNFCLSLDKKSKYYYSYSFYEKNIKPLNLELSNLTTAYAAIGININPIFDEFKVSVDKYRVAYNNYYYQQITQMLEVNSNDIDTLILRLKEINSSSNLKSLLSTIQKNVLEVKDSFLLENSFKEINSFYKDINDYNKLIDKYIDLLNKAKSNPQMLIDLYQNNKHPFEADMDEFLKNIKPTSSFDELLSQAALASVQVTTKLLQQYVQSYWNKNLEPIYNKIFDSFPFKENSNNEISADALTNLIGKQGSFWESYAKIAPLIKNYDSDKWLTDKQFKEYQKIQELAQLLWDTSGKPKAIKITLTTSGLLPSYNHIESSWYFFKDKKTSYYDGILSVDKNSISDIGVGGVKQTFEVQWWLDKVSSIALVSNNKNLVAQQTKEGNWSFWKLLKLADHNGNTFTWSFNNNNTKVSFDIDYPNIWFNK